MKATCPTCGADRAYDGVNRPGPCESCSEASIGYHVDVAARATAAASVSATLCPADQSFGWHQRWQQLERDLPRVTGPRAEELSAASILDAAADLLDLFTRAYHLKDALIAEGVVDRARVEAAVSHDADLALLADLANTDKHHVLSKKPRSGDRPFFGGMTGTTGSGQSGWSLEVEVVHRGRNRSGVELAGAAVAAWSRQLRKWGLLPESSAP